MKTVQTILPILLIATSIALTACGGGGGGSAVQGNAESGIPDSDLLYRANAVVDSTYEVYSTTETGYEQHAISQDSFGFGVSEDIAVSPDGRYVAFRAQGEALNIRELYVDDLNDSAPAVKVSGPLVAGGDVIRFKWSPTSDRLAYRADQDVNERFDLYTVRPDGQQLTRVNGDLITDGDVSYYFSWSPNGQRLAYIADQDQVGMLELYTVLPNGSQNTKVSGNLMAGGNVLNFKWSPDSQRLAYRADQDVDSRFELYSTTAIGLINAKINGTLTAGGDVYYYDWSADSSLLAYNADQDTDDKLELYVSGFVGQNKTRVSNLPDAGVRSVSSFKWSPNNNRLAFRALNPDDLTQSALYSVTFTGAQYSALSDPAAVNAGIDMYNWSPDGSLIAYISNAENAAEYELYTVGVTGSNRTKVNATLEAFADVGYFRWSPDSQRIAYVADQETLGVTELFTATPDGQNVSKVNGVLVLDGNVHLYKWAWSPDSARLAYIADQDAVGKNELYVADPDGQNNVKVSLPLTTMGNVSEFEWRP